MIENMWMRPFLAGLLVSGLGLAAGCGGAGIAKYETARDDARSSLEAALTAWRDGKSPGDVVAEPKVQVADSVWSGGARITAFAIGDDLTEEGGVKQFPVKLTFQKDGKVRNVRYAVHGRDPVWVFAEDDYRKMVNMDNGSEPDRPVRGRGHGRGRRGR